MEFHGEKISLKLLISRTELGTWTFVIEQEPNEGSDAVRTTHRSMLAYPSRNDAEVAGREQAGKLIY